MPFALTRPCHLVFLSHKERSCSSTLSKENHRSQAQWFIKHEQACGSGLSGHVDYVTKYTNHHHKVFTLQVNHNQPQPSGDQLITDVYDVMGSLRKEQGDFRKVPVGASMLSAVTFQGLNSVFLWHLKEHRVGVQPLPPASTGCWLPSNQAGFWQMKMQILRPAREAKSIWNLWDLVSRGCCSRMIAIYGRRTWLRRVVRIKLRKSHFTLHTWHCLFAIKFS